MRMARYASFVRLTDGAIAEGTPVRLAGLCLATAPKEGKVKVRNGSAGVSSNRPQGRRRFALENGLNPYRSAIVAILAASSLLVADAAQAQAGCYTLQAELMRSAEAKAAADPSATREPTANRRASLRRTEAEARQAGCFGGGFLFFRNQPSRACPSLVPKIRDMRANLAEARSAAAFARRLPQPAAGWRDQGHDGATAAARLRRHPRPDRRGLLPDAAARHLSARSACAPATASISPSASRRRAASSRPTRPACQALCPGTEAKLFAHSQSRRRSRAAWSSHRRQALRATCRPPSATGPVSTRACTCQSDGAVDRHQRARRRRAGGLSPKPTAPVPDPRARRRARIRRRSPTAWAASASAARSRRTCAKATTATAGRQAGPRRRPRLLGRTRAGRRGDRRRSRTERRASARRRGSGW